jgi:hypothetical protein
LRETIVLEKNTSFFLIEERVNSGHFVSIGWKCVGIFLELEDKKESKKTWGECDTGKPREGVIIVVPRAASLVHVSASSSFSSVRADTPGVMPPPLGACCGEG